MTTPEAQGHSSPRHAHLNGVSGGNNGSGAGAGMGAGAGGIVGKPFLGLSNGHGNGGNGNGNMKTLATLGGLGTLGGGIRDGGSTGSGSGERATTTTTTTLDKLHRWGEEVRALDALRTTLRL